MGPSDHVPWLTDRKWAYIRMEGTTFGNVPLNVEVKLEVWDSPNSAGVMIDAVRCAKLALDRELAVPSSDRPPISSRPRPNSSATKNAAKKWKTSSPGKARNKYIP